MVHREEGIHRRVRVGPGLARVDKTNAPKPAHA